MKAMKKAALSGAVLLLYSTGAVAQLSNQGLFDQVVTEFATRASAWQAVVMNAAMWLFWTLGAISLAWTGGMLILRKADIGDFFTELIRFIIFFGFFLWLLRNGPTFSLSIIQSLQRLGEQASGVSSVTPSGIVDIGFMLFKQSLANMTAWSPIDSVIGFVMSLGVLLLLATVGVNMLLLYVSSWILMYAGVIFLGFGGSRWTSDMAINYYKTVLGVAVQIFSMVLLVGIGTDLLSTFYSKMNKGLLNFEELAVMLVFCVALLNLTNKVPGLVASVVTGGGGGGSGIGQFGSGAVAGAALGAAGAVAAAAATGAKMLGAGAANVAGGAQALMAAFSKASENVSSGSDVMTSMLGGGGGGGSDSSTGSTPFAEAAGFSGAGSSASSMSHGGGGGDGGGGQQSKGSTGGLLASATKAGKIAADAGANLAKGAAGVAKTTLTDMKGAVKDRIADTTGGKIAAAIKGTDNNSAPTFSGNSLSGDNGVDAASEVAAFTNRIA